MRADLVRREPERMEHWRKTDLYNRIQQRRSGAKAFVLHDGPPFTNGDVHIGTALNKILKDSVLRYKTMRGFATPYIPGWDCHGLPIEHKVTQELRAKKQELDTPRLRSACADFSRSFIEKQREQFIRLGVLADWANEYRTMDPAYEAEILRTFATIVDKGLVYRGKKPVYWSIPCATALAEAEIEYKDHRSPSIWVRFPLEDPSKVGLAEDAVAGLVIWTTTPWTLPANLAVALHPDLDYVLVEHSGGADWVAEALAEAFIAATKLENARQTERRKGRDFEHCTTRHPFIDRPSPVVMADYVTTETGTGCVHTAPGHGVDDYLTGIKYGLEIYCPLDDNGCYIDDGQIPPALVGVSVLEVKGKCPANTAVLELLRDSGHLLACESYQHQYPHCWRSKTPVIFRAMDQWFVALDQDGSRQKCLDAIGSVGWIPAWGENRIRGAVESRPDWCVSRQRTWGVPLPVFYDDEKRPYLDGAVIRALADKIETAGTDLWFSASGDQLLDGIDLPPHWPSQGLTQGTDTLDVWIDSGCSHRAVLRKRHNLHWPADLYLEGSDQHRGWFQSSLWTGILADGGAPYKSIITHGFIVDEHRRKISKSDGKPQTADGYVQRYGADVLRLWLASEDYRNDIPISDALLKQVSNNYRTIRNTLRFLLGNLSDFSAATDAVAIDDMLPVDQWALARTHDFLAATTEAYDSYEFHRVYQLVINFCNVTLSATYHDLLKDRLYTHAPTWQTRRSAQTALNTIFEVLVKVLAPILTFTADEAYAYSRNDTDHCDDSIHTQQWPDLSEIQFNADIVADVAVVLGFRDRINEKLEEARQAKTIGQSLDAEVTIRGGANNRTFQLLQSHADQLNELFIVSATTLEASDCDGEPTVSVAHASGQRCPRSWRWVPELVEAPPFGPVSPRCRDALQSLSLLDNNSKT